jgi:hypothetical protein
MGVPEAFLAMFVPTGIGVYLLRQDVNHVAVICAWTFISFGVLGWLGADQPTDISGTPEESSAKLVYFYVESGASVVALMIGAAAGAGAGLWAASQD